MSAAILKIVKNQASGLKSTPKLSRYPVIPQEPWSGPLNFKIPSSFFKMRSKSR